MRIVLIGGTGYIGRATLRALAANGHSTLCLSRSISDEVAQYAGQEFLASATERTFEGADAVIQLAGRAHVFRPEADEARLMNEANQLLPQHWARVAQRAGVARFVHVSSLAVNGSWSSNAIDEASSCVPDTLYGKSKLDGENALRRLFTTTSSLVVVRPPMVYGPECPGNLPRLFRLLNSRIPLPLASLSAQRSFVYVENLADFLVHVADYRVSAQTYTVGDGSDYSVPELLRSMAENTGVACRLLPCPPSFLRLGASLAGLRREMDSLTRPMLVRWDLARTVAKWSPPVARALAMRTTVAAMRAR